MTLKLYNDQRNAQVFNLFIYLILPYMFRAFFWPIFRGRFTISAVVQVCWVWCKRQGADTIPNRLEPLPSCTPASEDGLKESPKNLRQK
jgi:hypothetical protein